MVNNSLPNTALKIPVNGKHSAAGGGDADGGVPGEDVEPPICGYTRPITTTRRGRGGSVRLGWLLLAVLLAALSAVGSATTVGSMPAHPRRAFPAPTSTLTDRSAWIAKFPTLTRRQEAAQSTCACKTEEKHNATFAVEAAMIPLLVILSGAFAGLTLGYMSLDATQLSVLAKSGTEEQKRLANKIAPLRKDGHLLLMTLIIANMCAFEPSSQSRSANDGLVRSRICNEVRSFAPPARC